MFGFCIGQLWVFLAIVLSITVIDAQEVQPSTNEVVHGFTIPPPTIKGIPLTFETIFSGTNAEQEGSSAAPVGRSSTGGTLPGPPSSFAVANQQSNVDIYALAASMLEAESNKLESAKLNSAQLPPPPPPQPQPIVPAPQPQAVQVVQAPPAIPVVPAPPAIPAVPIAAARPTIQVKPIAPPRPAFQAIPVAPARPAFQAIPVAPTRPTIQATPVAAPRPVIQAIPIAPPRSAVAPVPTVSAAPIFPVVPRPDQRVTQRFQLPQTPSVAQFATKGSKKSRQFIRNNLTPPSFAGRSSTLASPLIAHQPRLLTRSAIQAPQGIIRPHYATQVLAADFLNPRPFSQQALVAIQQPIVSSAQPVTPISFIPQRQPTALVATQPARQALFSNYRQSHTLPGKQVLNQVPLVNQGYPANLQLIAAPVQTVQATQFGIPGLQRTLQHSAAGCCTFFIQQK